jgi:hypothetical protein
MYFNIEDLEEGGNKCENRPLCYQKTKVQNDSSVEFTVLIIYFRIFYIPQTNCITIILNQLFNGSRV